MGLELIETHEIHTNERTYFDKPSSKRYLGTYLVCQMITLAFRVGRENDNQSMITEVVSWSKIVENMIM